MTDKNKNKELVEETVDAVETEVEAPIEEAQVAPVETAIDKPSKKDNKKRWYIVHTYSGYENKVKVNLEKRIEYMNMSDKIFRIEVPQKTVTQVKGGKKQEKDEKIFPGYVLVEMIMTDEAWYIVRNTPGVTGFIGSSGKGAKPTPLLPQEIDRILANMGMSRVDASTELQVGDTVNIIDGAFSGMTGKVDNIDTENNRLNIIIDLFGQETNVDVEVYQVSKTY